MKLTASKKGEKFIFHHQGMVMGEIVACNSGKTMLGFSFPKEIDIDREDLFHKKYPSTGKIGDSKGK